MSDEAPSSNTPDPEVLKEHLLEIEASIEKRLSHKMAYVESCKPYNDRITLAYETAAKVLDVPIKVLKAKIKERDLYAKIAAIPEDLNDDAQDIFQMVSEALGDFGDLPLGRAAKNEAAKATGRPVEEEPAPAAKKGGRRKAPSAAAVEEKNDESSTDKEVFDSAPFQAGYKHRMGDGGDTRTMPTVPSDFSENETSRDQWNNGWLKADVDARAAAKNAERLNQGIKGMPGAHAQGKATLQ